MHGRTVEAYPAMTFFLHRRGGRKEGRRQAQPHTSTHAMAEDTVANDDAPEHRPTTPVDEPKGNEKEGGGPPGFGAMMTSQL